MVVALFFCGFKKEDRDFQNNPISDIGVNDEK
jgi:hypothetical protein